MCEKWGDKTYAIRPIIRVCLVFNRGLQKFDIIRLLKCLQEDKHDIYQICMYFEVCSYLYLNIHYKIFITPKNTFEYRKEYLGMITMTS